MVRLIGFFVLALILARVLAVLPVVGPIFARTGIFGVWIAALLLSWAATRLGTAALRARRERAELQRLQAVDSPHNRGKAGAMLLARGSASKALSHLEAAAAGEPDVAEWQYRLGLARLALGRPREAADALSRAVSIDEEHAYGQALLKLAQACSESGEHDRALSAIERVERNHGPTAESAYRRGVALRGLGRKEEARGSFGEAGALAAATPRYQRREARAWAARAWVAKLF